MAYLQGSRHEPGCHQVRQKGHHLRVLLFRIYKSNNILSLVTVDERLSNNILSSFSKKITIHQLNFENKPAFNTLELSIRN